MGRIYVNPKGLQIRPPKYTEVLRQHKLKIMDKNYKEVQEHLECFVDPVIQWKPEL